VHARLKISSLALACSIALLAGCETSAPPPPLVRPAAFTPLGLNAPYLYGDVIGGHKSRAAKMKAAKIRPINPALAPNFNRVFPALKNVQPLSLIVYGAMLILIVARLPDGFASLLGRRRHA